MEKEFIKEVEQLEEIGCLIEKVEALQGFLMDKLEQVEKADIKEPREALFDLQQDIGRYKMLAYILSDSLATIDNLNNEVIASLMQ